MTKVKILIEGYAREEKDYVAASSTSVLIKDGKLNIIVDPGMNRKFLMNALKKENLMPKDINYVILSHYHLDHSLLTGIFENAKVLYADDIYGFEDKIALAIENSSLLNNLWPDSNTSTESASVQSVYDAVTLAGFDATSSASLSQNIGDLALTAEDVVLTSTASYVNKYFQVNGNAYIAGKLGIEEGIVIGDGMQLAYGIVNVLPNANNPKPTLHLQPSGGAMSLLAGLMTLDDVGQVNINGDLNVAGKLAVNDSLLTNLLKPVDYTRPIQIQLAEAATVSGRPFTQESRFEFVNQDGAPVATVSAHGKASFAGGIDVGSEDLTATTSSNVVSDQPSGKATIKAFTRDVIISSPLITDKSLIYVTPIGSTGNQVMYVKTQVAENPGTITTEGQFTVGFDYSLTQDASFNWWIVN